MWHNAKQWKLKKTAHPNHSGIAPHHKPKSVPNVAPNNQEGREVNTNTLPSSYQGLPLPSQSSEANWEYIAQPKVSTGQQPTRAMLGENPTNSSPCRSKRVTKPVDCLMMAMETLFEAMVKKNQTSTIKEFKGEIFCYQALFPEDFSDNNDSLSHLNPLMA